MASTPLPPAPPSSPTAKRPHVVVHPPEEECNPPYTCYDADEPLDTDPDVLDAIHSLQYPQHVHMPSDTDDEDEIYEVVRVRRRRTGEDETESGQGKGEDPERTPRPSRRRSIFSFRKSTESPAPVRKSLDSRQSLDVLRDEDPPRSSSPTPSFFARRFSIFSSTPSIPSLVSLPSFKRSRSTSRQSESSSSSSAGPETPSDDLAHAPHSPPRIVEPTPVQDLDQPQLKPKSSKMLRRLSSFRKPKPAVVPLTTQPAPVVPQPAPVEDAVLSEDEEGEMRLDSFHFDEGALSFDAEQFKLE